MNTTRWLPFFVLGCGVIAVQYAHTPAEPLRLPLQAVIPTTLLGLQATDLQLRDAEIQSAQATEYLARGFGAETAGAASIEVHVCYYDRADPNGWWTVSHRLCHMDPMWAIIAATTEELRTPSANGTVRRYLLRRGTQAAVSIFWYQSRGHVEEDGYRIRWNRLKASVLRRRSDETLVRVLVPVTNTQEEALTTARRIVHEIVPHLARALP